MLNRENVLKKSYIKDYNGFDFEELSNISKINLRGNSADKNFITNVGKILNTLIPIEPNTSNSNDLLKIIWLSPNEWLINFFDNNIFNETLIKLNNKLNSEKTSITDVSESKTIIRVIGNEINQLLRKFMILDIDNVLLNNSKVAQTIFVKIPILITRNHNDETKKSYDIYVNRSHTIYLRDLLVDGCNQLIN